MLRRNVNSPGRSLFPALEFTQTNLEKNLSNHPLGNHRPVWLTERMYVCMVASSESILERPLHYLSPKQLKDIIKRGVLERAVRRAARRALEQTIKSILRFRFRVDQRYKKIAFVLMLA